MKQTTSIKLDVGVKAEAQKIFAELGLTLGEAVTLFLNQVKLHKGLPFEVKIPNNKTIKVIQEARDSANMEETTLSELIDEMGAIRSNVKT